MVVVEHDEHIRLLLFQPFGNRQIAVEQGLPGRVLLLSLVVRHADGGNVRGTDASDDFRHGLSLRLVMARRCLIQSI